MVAQVQPTTPATSCLFRVDGTLMTDFIYFYMIVHSES